MGKSVSEIIQEAVDAMCNDRCKYHDETLKAATEKRNGKHTLSDIDAIYETLFVEHCDNCPVNKLL